MTPPEFKNRGCRVFKLGIPKTKTSWYGFVGEQNKNRRSSMAKHKEKGVPGQASVHQAEVLSQLCYVFVQPVLCRLHQGLDRRLVQTLLDLLQVMVMHRHRQQGLVLSELGGHLLGPAWAPAGTKRIDRLLKSRRWQAGTLIDFLWEKGAEAVHRLIHPQDNI